MQFSSHAAPRLQLTPHPKAVGVQTSNTRRAFTLIELLVCVSIIALLVALLLPSMQQARDRAKCVACKAGLHEILNASATFMTENDGALPNTIPAAVTANVSNTNIYRVTRCPRCFGDPVYGALIYGINAFGPTTRFCNLSNPAQTIFYGDEGGWSPNAGPSGTGAMNNDGVTGAFCFSPTNSLAGTGWAPDFLGIHANKGNIAWYDGSVTTETPMIPTNVPKAYISLVNMTKYHYGYLTPVSPGITYTAFAAATGPIAQSRDYYYNNPK